MAKKEIKMQGEAIARKMPEPKAHMDINDKDLPAIKSWEVGKTYEVKVKVKMIEKRQGERYPMTGAPADRKIRATFEIVSVDTDQE